MIPRVIIIVVFVGAASLLGWHYFHRPPTDIQPGWYESLRHKGEIRIPLKDGSIVVSVKRVDGRSLVDAVLKLYDPKDEMQKIIRSHYVELEHEKGTDSLVFKCRDGKGDSLDGNEFTFREMEWTLFLPSKR